MERRDSCEDPGSTAHDETAKTKIAGEDVEGAAKGAVCTREQIGTYLRVIEGASKLPKELLRDGPKQHLVKL